ncbi:MAG: amidohydrolase family protein [Acidobacteria bacterium]|nr:amidohydrolase family protein [Acidobacteriota bacterium]
MSLRSIPAVVGALFGAVVLAATTQRAPAGVRVFLNARALDGSGRSIPRATIVVRAGRIGAIGAASAIPIPPSAERIDLAGRTVIPGFINTHGHVADTRGLASSPQFYTEPHLLAQLQLYARYGITTVFSLGGDGRAGFLVRDAQRTAALDRARLYVAGPIIAAETPDAARQMVEQVAAMRPDIIKIRVDDNLQTTVKMSPAVYRAVIDQAHTHALGVAAHVFYLEDAKDLLRSGVDFIAHSVRDQDVDQELIALMKRRGICLAPTLTRELSTFVYESRPAFFDDPFFLRYADRDVLQQLLEPSRQQAMRQSRSAQQYKGALAVASRNVKALADAGVRVVLGTDTGPPARFQGYFEHLELELLAKAGLTPAQILKAATSDAAACMNLTGTAGSLVPGAWADLVVLRADPLADIRNSRTIHSVWIGGNRIGP